MRDHVNVGILGLGTIGTGVAKVLIHNQEIIRRRLGFPLNLKRAADIDLTRDRGVKLAEGVLTNDAASVIKDPEIDIIVELIGGYDLAKRFILEAIANRKHVVTANKALLAVHGEEIYAAAAARGVSVSFEASVGGGIPIIRAIREGLAANKIESIYGIVNGTCNYILTKMTDEGRDFDDVLKEAQRLGYAEADPSFDVGGIDSAHKLAILASLSFGTPVPFDEIYKDGITEVTPLDIAFAKEFGYKIKLLAITKLADGQIEARVHATMIPEDTLLATVDGVYNAIFVEGDAVGETLYYGKGAGELPTASAVVGDLMELARDVYMGRPDRVPPMGFVGSERRHLPVKKMEDIESLYYLRFMAMDRPGVLSKIAAALGDHHISIESVLQKGRKAGGAVPVVMMTHRALERDVRAALARIEQMSDIVEKTVLFRVEDEA